MPATRVSYKIFLTFTIIIALPVIGLSFMLSRISEKVDESRRGDRFSYAESYLRSSIDNELRYTESRLRQIMLDRRLNTAMEKIKLGGDASSELLLLMGEYGLLSLALYDGDDGQAAYGYRMAGYFEGDDASLASAERYSATVSKDGILFLVALPVTGDWRVAAISAVQRTQLEVLNIALGADFDILAYAEPNAPVLTTRRDPFGANLSGAPYPADQPGSGYAFKAIQLPPPLTGSFFARISLPQLSESVSEISAYIAAFALATILLSSAASLILSRQIVRPLVSLLSGVRGLSYALSTGEGFKNLAIPAKDELGDLTVAFNTMGEELITLHGDLKNQNVELKEVSRLKDEFLGTTSSALRSPLNSIVSLAESMQNSTALSEDDRKTVRLIASTGKKLYGMIGDVLDYTKLEYGDIIIRPRPCELKPIVDIVLRFCSGLKPQAVELFNLVDPDLIITADEARMEQVLYNIIGRAVRTTRQGTVIVRSQRDGNQAIISVSDTGSGLDPDTVEEEFLPFGSTAPKKEYAGLELPIAKRLIELHGSALEASSSYGKGATLSFKLPVVSHEDLDAYESGAVPKIGRASVRERV